MAIQVRGLRKRYGRILAVDGVSFDIPESKVTGFVGPNGAGKTTTIKSILGLVRVEAGEVRVDGIDWRRREARRLLAYAPETPDAPPWIKPVELLEVIARLEGFNGEDARREALRALDELEVRDRAHQPIGSLSKGLRKRVLIAQALINIESKRYVLLDEPFSGLDPGAAQLVRRLIRKLRSMGLGVLVSSHLLRELEDLADHLVIISRGRVVFKGSLSELSSIVGGYSTIEVRVDNVEAAVEALRRVEGVEIVEKSGDFLSIRVYGDARRAIDAIFECCNPLTLSFRRASLEEAYVKLVMGRGA